MFCCTLLNVHSSFAIVLVGKRELVAFLVSLGGCVALPRGAMGLSAVCDCSISCSYSLTIFEAEQLDGTLRAWSHTSHTGFLAERPR